MKTFLLFIFSIILALGVVEVGSRYIMPVKYGNTIMTLDGQPLPVYSGDEELRPDMSYRVVSQEFDTVVTHTKEGYRGLARPENPEVVFVGDSFTYGMGLNDKETIPHLYCHLQDLVCANLGVPGTATVRQLARLERYLTKYNWHPREVKVMFMGMTGALLAGNDFNGNLEEMADRQSVAAPAAGGEKGVLAQIVDRRAELLERSNLVRIAYYIGGPMLRAKLSPETDAEQLKKAMAVTAQQFAALKELAAFHKFSYSIYIIHPMQDVMTGGYENTLAVLKQIAQTDRVYSTAPALTEGGRPEQYYYAMDGHLNARGAEKVARYMAGLDATLPQQNGNKSSEM